MNQKTQTMKSITFILLVLTFNQPTKAQSLKKLITNNGFQEFKFDSSPSSHKKISYIKTVNGSEKIYNYTGAPRRPYHNMQCAIELIFKSNRLREIQIKYKYETKMAYDQIRSELEKTYGPSKQGLELKTGEERTSFWKSGAISLSMHLYDNGHLMISHKKVRL